MDPSRQIQITMQTKQCTVILTITNHMVRRLGQKTTCFSSPHAWAKRMYNVPRGKCSLSLAISKLMGLFNEDSFLSIKKLPTDTKKLLCFKRNQNMTVHTLVHALISRIIFEKKNNDEKQISFFWPHPFIQY